MRIQNGLVGGRYGIARRIRIHIGIALCLPLVGVGAATLPECDIEDLVEHERYFLDLFALREWAPEKVPEALYQRAAVEYVQASEACYDSFAPTRTTINTLAIDNGGLWYSGPSSDGLQSGDYTLYHTKWGADSPFVPTDGIGPQSAGGVVTYSFIADGTAIKGLEADGIPVDDATAITSLPNYQPCFTAEITAALSAWSAAADIDFVEVADNGAPFNDAGAAGEIRIGAHTIDGPFGALAHAFYPPPNGVSAAGDIHFDLSEKWSCDASGLDIGVVAIHEIGHALGLEHELSTRAVMMGSYDPTISGLQLDDTLGAVAIYGAKPVDPSQLAQLLVQPVDIDQGHMVPNQPITLSATVVNQGDGSSNWTTLRYLLSEDAVIDPNDIELATKQVAPILPSATSPELVATSAVTTGGHYYIGACIVGDTANTPLVGCSFGVEVFVEPAYTRIGELSPDTATAGHQFGSAIALSGNRLLAGGRNTGAAFLFEQGEDGVWRQSAVLEIADPGRDFGSVVALSGDLAAVADPGDVEGGYGAGAVHLFERQADGQWLWTEKLMLAVPDHFERFGAALHLAGERLFVGAPGDDYFGTVRGAVYEFERLEDGTWGQMARITPIDTRTRDLFGTSIDIDGTTLLIGAPRAEVDGIASGAAWLFERQPDGGWAETARVVAAQRTDGDYFGRSVALQGGHALIGAPYANDINDYSGSAHTFALQADGSWGETHRLVSPVYALNFGRSVALDGDLALISYSGSPGGIYHFRLQPEGQSLLVESLGAVDGSTTFGYTLAASGDRVAVGSPNDDSFGSDAGALVVYDLLRDEDLTTVVSEGGAIEIDPTGIRCDSDCSTPFTTGAEIILTPTPDTGYAFTGWSGACAGTAPCTLVMAMDRLAVARFDPLPPEPAPDIPDIPVAPPAGCANRIEGVSLSALPAQPGCFIEERYSSLTCIETGDQTIVASDASVRLEAPKISLQPGFHVAAGASFTAGTTLLSSTATGALAYEAVTICSAQRAPNR